MTLADQPARDAIRRDLDATLVVEAAAGTGKTTELVRRVLALLETGKAKLSSLALVTFTEKAAAEMKLRLRTEIDRHRDDPGASSVERQRLDRALEDLEIARIGTIHAFCAEILRERPVEAEIDPLFEVAAEDEARRIYDRCFDRWFQGVLDDPPEGVQRVLRRRGSRGESPRAVLSGAGWKLVDQRDFPAPWTRRPFDRIAALDAAVERLARLGAIAATVLQSGELREKNWLVEHLREVERRVTEIRRKEAVVGRRDHDGLEAELKAIVGLYSWPYQGGGKTWLVSGVRRAEVIAERDDTLAFVKDVLARCDADLAACLYLELQPLTQAYQTDKGRAGRLDFRDLLAKTRDLVRDHDDVRNELQARLSHLLVDEFQDTDPVQAEILLLLASNDGRERDASKVEVTPGKLFVVGDPKQSIYRFRRADVALYEAVKQRLVANGAKLVHLTTSFRGAPSIQRAIDAAFEPLMTGEGGQARYVGLSPFQPEPPDHPTLIALPAPRPYSEKTGKLSGYYASDSLADAVGAWIDWVVRKSGWTVAEAGERVPIATRHVCLLFKRLVSGSDDLTRPYVRAMEQRRLPHVLVGGKSFHEREEVIALRCALQAIEWPDDEHSVYATLRGPFLALGDDQLLAFRAGRALNPLSPPDPGALSELLRPVAGALELLRELHKRRNRRPIADTIRLFLDATRAHAGVAIWPAGEQALVNVVRVMDLARRFEASRATSFRAFVRKLEEDAERGGAGEAPAVEEGTEGVRIMTVHKAKGLEFPVVVLADLAAPASPREPSHFVDATRGLSVTTLARCVPHELAENGARVLEQEGHEALRVLYVAATRARELLVVPVVGDGRVEGWVDPLHRVVYPRPGRAPVAHIRCPPFGRDTVSYRPPKVDAFAQANAVSPGEYAFEAHKVVWWDPSVLELQKEDTTGLRQQLILAADDSGVAAKEGEDAHLAWTTRLERLRTEGAEPGLRVRTVTERREGDLAIDTTGVRIERTGVDRVTRPGGKRFGVLVHAILAEIALEASRGAIERMASVQGRVLGASREEVTAATEAVAVALEHPVLTAARRARRVWREAPVSTRDPDGAITEGVIDLVYEDDGGIVVVDFKTDQEIDRHLGAYARQVAMYGDAVARVLAKPARCVLLQV